MAPKRTREDCDSDSDEELSDEEGGIRVDEDIYIPPPPRRLSQLSENGARLIISKIIITNFKSYAGKVVLQPFNISFSAIVGPNGSGKSNVIDAMLFVFGYRATKIRSTSIGVLIHNSSEHRNITECKVSIYMEKVIDAPEGIQTVPGSLLKISRRGYKNNTSRYEMNDKTVQFREIERRLKAEGIDLDHSRFLILQGEVEQIALMKPKAANESDTGMLEFLDSIIGTSRIKEPLQKISEKLQDLTEHLREREQRLRLVENERDELRGPMQEAVKYLKTENTINQLKNTYFQIKRYETREAMRESEEANRDIEEQYASLKKEIKEVKEKLGEKTNEYEQKSQKWSDVHRRKDAIDKRYQELSKRDENLHAQLVEKNKRRKENKVQMEKEQAKLEELQRVPDKNAKSIEECETFIEKQQVIHEREDREYKEMMEAVHKKTEPLNKKREVFEQQMMEFTEELNRTRAAFNLAETELKLYLSTEEKERETFEKLKEELRTSTQKIEKHSQELKNLAKKIPTTEASLKKAQDKLAEIKAQETELSAELNNLRVRHNEQNQAMRKNKSQNRVLAALMEEKNSGRIPGILGRLGDLGAIDAKYDIAVSTACGPLDNIVVDDVDTAEACIEFLKKNNVGRTTFIALKKQERWLPQMNQKVNTPENVPRLFDLIRVGDERVKPAFYFGLRNTLVANDLEQATRIAYGGQRHRVVTLKGELIEMTGTMSGGGRPFSGRMGQSVRTSEICAADLEKLEKKMDDVCNECNRLRAQQPVLEEQVRTLTTELQEMLKNRVEFSAEVEALKTMIPALKKKLELQTKKVDEAVIDPEKVKKLTEARDQTQEEFEVVNKKSQTIQKEIDKINNKINEIVGNRIKEKQKVIDELVEGIEKAKKEIIRLKVASTAAENNAEKARRKIANLKNDIDMCVQNITDGQKERAELENEAKELKEKQTECEEALVERNQVLGELNKEIEKLKAQEAELKSSKIDLDQKIAASRKLISEFQGKIQGYEAKLAGLKLRKIPEQPEETLPVYTDEELADLDSRTVKANLDAAIERLPAEMPNMKSIEDFEKVNERFFRRAKEAEEISNARNMMCDHFDRVTRMRREEFKAGFDEICTSLKELYQMITQGGAAELEYADSLDPYADGIVFSVRPPKKSWKNISNLSGGEKTLSSLALVFALHNYKPTPLYFMDEIDAALDFKNVSIIANYIKDKTENAQFIVISLRSEMFELAATLIGIYKTDNSTKTVTVIKKNFYQQHPEIEQMERERNDRHQGHKNAVSQPVDGNGNHHVYIPLSCPAKITETETVARRLSPVLAERNEEDNTEGESSNLELDYELGLKERPQPKNEEVDDSLGLEESSLSIDDHEDHCSVRKKS